MSIGPYAPHSKVKDSIVSIFFHYKGNNSGDGNYTDGWYSGNVVDFGIKVNIIIMSLILQQEYRWSGQFVHILVCCLDIQIKMYDI